jgi:hypothetical protein
METTLNVTIEYQLGYEDGWNGNFIRPEYENNQSYLQGYNDAVDERNSNAYYF